MLCTNFSSLYKRLTGNIHVPALAKSLGQPLLSVALALPATLDSHVQRAKMVLQFQINRSLSCGKIDLLDVLREGNFVDLRDVLQT